MRRLLFVLLTSVLGGVFVQKTFARCYENGNYRARYAIDCGCYDYYCPNGVTSTGNCSLYSACEGQALTEPVLPSNCFRELVSISSCNSDLFNVCSFQSVGTTRCAGQGVYAKAYCCDSQAEADSVKCALNPTAPGCVSCDTVVIDDCKNEYMVNLGAGGYWAAVQVRRTYRKCTDGTEELISEQVGSELPNVDCRENPFGPDSSKSDSMRCVGQIGPNCIIQVGPNQSFMCPCEGCEYLSKTCSDIMDSLSRSSSSRSSSSSASSESSSSQGGSSGSEGGSSGSEGGEGGSSGSGGATSSGIDYSGQLKKLQNTLDAVRNNTAITAGFVQSIDNKMNVINNTFENGTTVITDALGNVVNTIVDELHDGWTIIGDGQERILDAITDSSGIGQVPSAPSTVDTAEIDSTVEVPEPDTIVRPDSSYVDADSLVASIFSSVDTLTGDSLLAELHSMSSWLAEPDTSEIESLIASKNNSLDDTISDAIDDGVDSLNAHYYSPFDSIVDATFVGMQNTNDCPESCWKFTADVPFTFRTLKIDFDFSDYLCGAVPISFLSNHGVLYFLKIVLRLVTAFFACFLIARYMKDVLIK